MTPMCNLLSTAPGFWVPGWEVRETSGVCLRKSKALPVAGWGQKSWALAEGEGVRLAFGILAPISVFLGSPPPGENT